MIINWNNNEISPGDLAVSDTGRLFEYTGYDPDEKLYRGVLVGNGYYSDGSDLDTVAKFAIPLEDPLLFNPNDRFRKSLADWDWGETSEDSSIVWAEKTLKIGASQGIPHEIRISLRAFDAWDHVNVKGIGWVEWEDSDRPYGKAFEIKLEGFAEDGIVKIDSAKSGVEFFRYGGRVDHVTDEELASMAIIYRIGISALKHYLDTEIPVEKVMEKFGHSIREFRRRQETIDSFIDDQIQKSEELKGESRIRMARLNSLLSYKTSKTTRGVDHGELTRFLGEFEAFLSSGKDGE